MLMGEHAVLHGNLAIVAAIAARVFVELRPRTDHCIHLHSDTFGEYKTTLPITDFAMPFQFVLATIQRYQTQCDHGFDVYITSNIDPTTGLGSSAAVTVAMLHALAQFTDQPLSREACHQHAHAIIQQVQGGGSGADAAASCFGGVLAYRMAPYSYQPLAAIPPLHVFYAGYKTPTATVIDKVNTQQEKYPELFDALYHAMACCCERAVLAWQHGDWHVVADMMRHHHGLQVALGTSDAQLNTMIDHLQRIDGILAAKISGSGLGDCVVSLGEMTDPAAGIASMQTLPGVVPIPTSITHRGLDDEKN